MEHTPTDAELLESGGKTSPHWVRNEKGEIVSAKSVEEELKKKYPQDVKPGVIRGVAFKASAAFKAGFDTARAMGASVHDAHTAAEKAKADVLKANKLDKQIKQTNQAI